jgi:hypothetical protein
VGKCVLARPCSNHRRIIIGTGERREKRHKIVDIGISEVAWC